MQLFARERYYIDTLDCINKVKPLRTNKEYWEDNKDDINMKRREHRKENNEQVKAADKKFFLGGPSFEYFIGI